VDPTQGSSVLYVCTKFETDSCFRSKSDYGVPKFARPETTSRGRGTAEISSAADGHYLNRQTEMVEHRCTSFTVIAVTQPTPPACQPQRNTHTHTHTHEQTGTITIDYAAT